MANATQVIVDDTDRTFLVLRATVAHEAAATDVSVAWFAEVADPANPLAGLYAFGDSFAAARDALAVVAWAAVEVGELRAFGVGPDSLAGIHVVASTCATYDGESLAVAVANDAA
jgi:hypothetical protein